MNLDAIFGIHPQILQYRNDRSAVLASNIANVDTPHYKSMDLQFSVMFNKIADNEKIDIKQESFYRIPLQKSKDGNTVELEREQAKFAQNAMEYQQSLAFLKSKIAGLKNAIKGE